MMVCSLVLPGINEVPQAAVPGVVRAVTDAGVTCPPDRALELPDRLAGNAARDVDRRAPARWAQRWQQLLDPDRRRPERTPAMATSGLIITHEGPSQRASLVRECARFSPTQQPSTQHKNTAHSWSSTHALPAEVHSRLWTVDCLGSCERSNVVVVRNGESRRSFGEVLDGSVTEALAGWIAAGAAGDPPTTLAAREVHADAEPAITAQPIPLRADDLAAMVHRTLADEAGAWSRRGGRGR